MILEKKKQYIANVMREYTQDSYINKQLCKQCGACCKIGGCQLMTCDVSDMSVEGIRKMLDTEKYSIYLSFGWIDEEKIALPIMCAKEVDSGRVKASFFRKQCALLGKNGCLLDDDERPTLGLLFIPKPNRDCKLAVSNEEMFFDWYPHKSILDEVVLLETGKTTEEIFSDAVEEAENYFMLKLNRKEELTYSEVMLMSLLLQI